MVLIALHEMVLIVVLLCKWSETGREKQRYVWNGCNWNV